MKFETLTRLSLWLLQKGSASRLFDVTVTDAQSDAEEMWTQNSGIHTSLVAIRRCAVT